MHVLVVGTMDNALAEVLDEIDRACEQPGAREHLLLPATVGQVTTFSGAVPMRPWPVQ